MKNTEFTNLSLPEGTDKIDIEVLNNDFTAIENLLKQHAIIETMTLNGEGVIIGAIGPYIRLQNIDTVQVSIDIGKETFTLVSGENIVIRETAENIGIITSGNVHITYFVNPKTYADKEFYTKKKVDELLSKVEATVEVDAELSETSENPVQNKVITQELASYATTAEVESKVTEKVAEIVAGAPEDFDTLKEMSDWLIQHEDSAATMNSAIQKNAKDITTANTNITKNAEDIATANENITKNTADIATSNENIAKNVEDIATANENIAKNVDDITANLKAINIVANQSAKNLLKPDQNPHTAVLAGVTFKIDDSGIVTANGTASKTEPAIFHYTTFANGFSEKKKYILTGCPAGGSESKYSLSGWYTDTWNSFHNSRDFGEGQIVTIDANRPLLFRIVIAKGYTVENLVFKPMLRPIEITDDTYIPYAPTNRELYEQINTLLARIEALETATTEGGE